MMGSAMTEHLLGTGAEVTVFDLDANVMATAVGQGATAAGSPAEVAQGCDIVSICVPAAHHVEAVLTGDGGLGEGAREGLSILIHSTVHPDTIISANETASAWGARAFDACVAGGGSAALEGELAMFVGGMDDMSPECVALLNIYGSKVINGGKIGTGAALKIGVNIMTYMQQAAARTAFALVEQHDTDTNALVDAWKHTGQLGKLTEQFLALLTLPQDFIDDHLRPGLEGTSGLAVKDTELALQLGSIDPELEAILHALAGAQASINRLN
jgi:3-hydroxyisobutyrate dehydrogenase